MIKAYRKAKVNIDKSIRCAKYWAEQLGASHYFVAGHIDKGYDAIETFMNDAQREMSESGDWRRLLDRNLARKKLRDRLTRAIELICNEFGAVAA
jgi:hypothetical protein